MKNPQNPFITVGYAGPEWFCNRKEETESLLRSIESGLSITLTSIRRIGKTGLIKHVLTQLPKNLVGIYFDIQPAENLNDFLNVLATSLINAVPEKSKPGKVIWDFIKTLRPIISFEHLTGLPQVTIDSRPGNPEPDIEAILRFLENQPFKIVVAIDEFQQILNFPEKNIDAWLRSKIQQLNNVTFIFAGSQQHLMGQLFNSPSKPFYRSTQFMKLNKIPNDAYRDFICRMFKKGNRRISNEIADEVLEWTNHHTYYVQLLCNCLYSTGELLITRELWQSEAMRLIKETETVFFNYRELLTNTQWTLLKALGSEDKVFSPTSKDFLQKYHLGSSATVIQSLKSLIKKELVFKDFNEDGKAFYSVYDLLFQHWIRNE
jgi:AAA+ ATPase superfamily predicted ATPase